MWRGVTKCILTLNVRRLQCPKGDAHRSLEHCGFLALDAAFTKPHETAFARA
jgi:hypothetical protein